MLRKYIIMMLVPMATLLLAVFQQVRVVNAGYELENMMVEASDISLQKERLEGELAVMKSPEKLLSRARELDMQFELPVVSDNRIALMNSKNGR